MKISELIEQLQEIQNDHGDLEVILQMGESPELNVEQALEDEDVKWLSLL